MENIIKHIEYLISRRDCVIIPGFGAILAQHKDAEYDVLSNSMIPPKRIFTYNRELAHSDGILAYSLSRKEGISYNSAIEKISSSVEDMNRQLHNCGELDLGYIGSFSYDCDSNSTTFTPSTTDRLSVSTFGLPIVRSQVEADDTTIHKEVRIIPLKTTPYLRVLKAAASIALLIGICFVASTPISFDDAALASLCPPIKPASTESYYQPAEDVELIDSEISSSYSAMPETPEMIDSEIQSTYSANPVAPTLPESDKWIIVVGSFRVESEALAYIQQNSAKNYKYIKSGRNYRVYTSAHSSKNDAYKAFADQKLNANEAWICKL